MVFSLLLAACASDDKPSNRYRSDNSENRPLVEGKYTLSGDREEMETYRNEVPENRRRENDELALVMGGMSGYEKTPSQVREEFDSLLRKRREKFQNGLQREREDFTKVERKSREDFLKAQSDQRKEFMSTKHQKEEQSEFHRALDDKRKEYMGNQREKRDDFESDVRERRKNFEDYVRGKRIQFEQEYRSYVKKYNEHKTAESDKKRRQEEQERKAADGSGEKPRSAAGTDAEALRNELRQFDQVPGSKLGTDDE